MLKSAILLALLLGCPSIGSAGKAEEKLMAEKPIGEERRGPDADFILRMIWVPLHVERSFPYSITVDLPNGRNGNVGRGKAGGISVVLRAPGGRFLKRSRPLKPSEIFRIWNAIEESELFSLPKRQSELMSRLDRRINHLEGNLFFELLNTKTKSVATVERAMSLSLPARHVNQALRDTCAELLKDIEKEIARE